MQFRGLLIGLVILAALGGAVWWSERNPPQTDTKGSDAPKLVTLKEDDINRIEIVRRDEPPTVLQKDKGGWQMTAPKPLRVDTDAVATVASTFAGLNWDRLVDEKPSDLNQFGLAQPAVKLSVNGKQTLLIGDEMPTGGNFYAKLDGDPRVFSVLSGTKSSLDKGWKDLQDKRLLTIDDSKLTRVEVTAKGQVVEFGKNAQNEWQMVKPRPLRADNWAVEELVRKLKDARMDTSVSDADAAAAAGKFGWAARIAAVNLTDASGTHTIEVRKSGEDYLAKSTAVEGIHKVSNDVGEGLNKGIEDFRQKKLFDFGFNDPTKIGIRHADKRYDFVKGGEKWWFNGKEMDPTSVQSLIDKLRDLSATGFADAGMTAPVMEIAVTSNDGKRNEKVLIAKAGDAYLAQRENEPSIYRLDAKVVDEIGQAAADVKAPPPPAPAKK
jgi:hypothetical protein